MKKIVNMFMICLTLLICGIFVGCNDDNNANMGVALHDSQGLEYYPLDDGSYAVSLGNAQLLKKLVFPETFNEKPVTTIIAQPGTSSNEIMTEEVIISNNITSLGDHAFANYENLKEITVPNSVTKIGESAFYNCKNLSQITLSENISELKNQTFAMCSSLKEINISSNIKTFGYRIFQGCTNLTTANVYASQLSDALFYNCKNLDNVNLTSEVTTIPTQCFYNCKLSNFEIPSQITKIEDEAFMLSGITEFQTNNNLVEIGDYAFYGCNNLKQINIPNTIKDFGQSVFENCKNLESAIIDIPTINYRTFSGCTKLNNLKLSDNVITIETHSLKNCDLSYIVLPSNIQTINDPFDKYYSAFKINIYFLGNETKWNSINFEASNYYDTYYFSEINKAGNYWHYDTDGTTPIKWTQTA